MPIVGRRCFCAVALLLLLGAPAASVDLKKKKNHDGPAFGSQKPVHGALRGTVYRLIKGTSRLPDFTRLEPVGVVYTTYLDYPMQVYTDEWFAIDYEGDFYVTKAGKYHFALTSDDGARLFVDGKRIIDNDGIHAPETTEGSIRLEAGMHHLRVPYFQGPREYVALVLEVEPPGGKTRVFDTDDFPPPPPAAVPLEERPTLKRK
jgi:hypothetical protein